MRPKGKRIKRARPAKYSASSLPLVSECEYTQILEIPSVTIGCVMGKYGATIKEIEIPSETRINIDELKQKKLCTHKNLLYLRRQVKKEEISFLTTVQEVSVRGDREGIRKALWMIYDLLARYDDSKPILMDSESAISARSFWISKRDGSQRLERGGRPGKRSKRLKEQSQQTISFFDLPAEIRNTIYEYTILCPTPNKREELRDLNARRIRQRSPPPVLEDELNRHLSAKSSRTGSTTVLCLSRQTYLESHGYFHSVHGTIEVYPGPPRAVFPPDTEVFLPAHDQKNYKFSPVGSTGLPELSRGTSAQYSRLFKLDIDIAYFVYMNPSDDQSLRSRLARVFHCIKINSSLQTLTIKFKRYGACPHIAQALVPVVTALRSSLVPFIMFRGSDLTIRAVTRVLRPHREGIVDPYGDETLVTWFNEARESWVQGVRDSPHITVSILPSAKEQLVEVIKGSLILTGTIPPLAISILNPEGTKVGSGHSNDPICNPFAGRENVIVKLERKQSRLQELALAESEAVLEDVHRMYQLEYAQALYCRKHANCKFLTASRKELRRHKRYEVAPSEYLEKSCPCLNNMGGSPMLKWYPKSRGPNNKWSWEAHIQNCRVHSSFSKMAKKKKKKKKKKAAEVDWNRDFSSLFGSDDVGEGDVADGEGLQEA